MGVGVKAAVSLACDPPCCSLLSLFFAVGVVVRRHHCMSLSSTIVVIGNVAACIGIDLVAAWSGHQFWLAAVVCFAVRYPSLLSVVCRCC